MSPFARNLKNSITENRLSQKEVAAICGVAPSVVSGWLTGSSPTNLIAVQKYAHHFNISFEWLLTGNYPKEQVEDSKTLTQEISGVFRIHAVKISS